MLNLRVEDLDGMVAALRAAGIEVKIDPEVYPKTAASRGCRTPRATRWSSGNLRGRRRSERGPRPHGHAARRIIPAVTST